ncbi:hypothetical protein FRC11_007579 [Ceratobasidium sp. 423]|nr:hypothetical protein FRC11_007579 [Ceratobasidium sp. 423]
MRSLNLNDKGGMEVHWNVAHAQWVTGYYDVVEVVACKANYKSYCHANWQVVMIDGHIPQLNSGKGPNQKNVCTAICGFSKKFQRENLKLFQKPSHLVNSLLTTPPNVLPFLEKYPKQDSDSDLEPKMMGMPIGIQGEPAVLGNQDDANWDQDANDTWMDLVMTEDKDEEADTKEVMEHGLCIEPSAYLPSLSKLSCDHPKPGLNNSVIDPNLCSSHPTPSETAVQAPTRSGELAVVVNVVWDDLGHPVGPPMLLPLELQPQVDLSVTQVSGEAEVLKKPKQNYKKGEESAAEMQTNVPVGQEAAPVKQKPGQPAGSKNKPKDVTQNKPTDKSAATSELAKKHGWPFGSKNKPKDD